MAYFILYTSDTAAYLTECLLLFGTNRPGIDKPLFGCNLIPTYLFEAGSAFALFCQVYVSPPTPRYYSFSSRPLGQRL